MIGFLLAASTSAYSICNPTDYIYAGKSVTANFYRAGTQSMQVNGQTVEITVKGSVTVVDGCTFRFNNVSFTGPTSVKVYGGFKDGSGGVVTVSNTIVSGTSAAPFNGELKFKVDPGAWVSWKDFNQFRLFDDVSQVVIANADLPADLKGTEMVVTTPVPSQPSGQQGGSQPSGQQGGSQSGNPPPKSTQPNGASLVAETASNLLALLMMI